MTFTARLGFEEGYTIPSYDGANTFNGAPFYRNITPH